MKDKIEWLYGYVRLDKDSKLRESVEFFKFFKDFFKVVDDNIPKEMKKRGGGTAKRGAPMGGGGGMPMSLIAELKAKQAQQAAGK